MRELEVAQVGVLARKKRERKGQVHELSGKRGK